MAGDARSEALLEGLEDAYDQVKLMAVGGMAEVYRGRQKNLDRPVAIKRMRPEFRSNKDLRERFRREAKISANLLHQNLAHVYDYRVIGDDAYIVMEWIDGFDLAQLIHDSNQKLAKGSKAAKGAQELHGLPLDVATMVAIRVLEGLSYIHGHAMVHRDLKPDNVRITSRGEIKIMDFGIAYDPAEAALTSPGLLIGSPHYLSPEQVRGEKLDQRADIFSFGITFYEMLTGKRPFFETQKETVYSRIQKGEYIPPSNIRLGLPHFYEKVIDHCLSVDVERRPESAHEVAATLSEFLARQAGSGAFEPRIRQYLLQSGAMSGDPERISVGERTMAGGGDRVFTLLRSWFSPRRRKRLLWAAGVAFFLLLAWSQREFIQHSFFAYSLETLSTPKK